MMTPNQETLLQASSLAKQTSALMDYVLRTFHILGRNVLATKYDPFLVASMFYEYILFLNNECKRGWRESLKKNEEIPTRDDLANRASKTMTLLAFVSLFLVLVF